MVNEKRLYDLLITVYRSPELMIKMTGVKQQYYKDPVNQGEHIEASSKNAAAPGLAFGGSDSS